MKSLVATFLANSVLSSPLFSMRVRSRLYRVLGFDIQGAVSFGMFCRLNVSIGAGTYINANCFIDGTDSVRIGERCLVGMDVLFVTSTHDLEGRGRYGRSYGKPIEVGDRCWIGARATVLPGVRIADDIVVAAGAVVTESLDEPGVYAGVPARRVRDL